jgi:hypothetical protein
MKAKRSQASGLDYKKRLGNDERAFSGIRKKERLKLET